MANNYIFQSKDRSIRFCSLEQAERIQPTPDMGLVSLLDPDTDNSIDYDQWKHKVIVRFEDVERGEEGRIFTASMARAIIDFVVALPADVRHITVHCRLGVARSAAVVRFLTRAVFPACFNETFDREYTCYNRTVFKVLEKVWKNKYAERRDPQNTQDV